MKPSILILALTAITITSCTSAYKSGQTPDDVYFSPQRTQSEDYVGVRDRDRDEDPGYADDGDYYGDRYLQMKVKNRYQWSDLDDYYSNDRYSYGFGGYGGYSYNSSLYWNNPWSPVSYWNYYYNPYYSSYYNPYYSPIFVIGTKYPTYNNTSITNRPRSFNLNSYNNRMITSGRYTNGRVGYNNSNNTYQNNNLNTNRYNGNYRNTRSSAGNYLRNAFNGNNNNSNNNNNSSRSYNNNNSSSSSSSGGGRSSGSSSSGSSAPVRKF